MHFTNGGVGLSPNLKVQLNTNASILSKKNTIYVEIWKAVFLWTPLRPYTEIYWKGKMAVYKQACEEWLKHPMKLKINPVWIV